jgi:hypothetical protein
MTFRSGKLKTNRATLVFALVSLLLRGLAAWSPTAAAAADVTFGWEPSADPSVVGYNIYYGTVSQVYTNKVSTGNMTMATISNLVEGQTYYFAATTYDVLNQESVFSAEISYTVPLPDTNQPPLITQMPETITANVGQSLACQISATDAGALSYSLGTGAPAGAWINPNTGLFVWNPQASQAGTTNAIPVIVTDDGNSPLSTAQSFTVVVQDYFQLAISSDVVATNSTGGVALVVYASSPVTNLQFTLDFPAALLTNFFFSGTNPLVGNASIAATAPGQAMVVVTTGAGQSIIGAQTLGTIGFNSVDAPKTMTACLQTDQPMAWYADGTFATNVMTAQGSVTIVGQDSMVEAQLAGGVRNLIVYGPMGATYQVESCNTLNGPGTWADTMAPFTMTNLSQTFTLPPDTNPATFYRTQQMP